jgi:1,4-dihydroxy-2-naphthoyl-CoA hydrolase
MYSFSTTVRLHHTDAAGILFFANLFIIAHECYETYLDPEVNFHFMFNEKKLMMPIVHAGADYLKPLRVSDRITIQLRLKEIGKSSFHLGYDIINEDGEMSATVETSHVVRNKDGSATISLPDVLREKLESLK